MQKKLTVLFLGAFLFLIGVGVYFVILSVNNENANGTETSETTAVKKGKETSSNQQPSSYNNTQSNNKESHFATSNGLTIKAGSGNEKAKQQQEGLIVDQQTNFAGSSNISTQQTATVLGAIIPPISMEFILIDGEKNKPISNYPVELKSKFPNESQNTLQFMTDEQGKFVFSSAHRGFALFQLFTKDFSIHSYNAMMKNGKNAYIAKLYKGGRLEIKVSTSDNGKVENILAKINFNGRMTPNNWRMRGGSTNSDGLEMEYDKIRNLFFLDNLPTGAIDIAFKASNYIETATYKISIESQTPSSLELHLLPAKVVTLDLQIIEKPDMIYVALQKFNRGVGRDVLLMQDTSNGPMVSSASSEGRRNNSNRNESSNRNENFASNMIRMGNEQTEVFKNEKGLYIYEATEPNVTNIIVYVNKYVPKNLTLIPNQDVYQLYLVEGSVGQVQLKNEEGKPISDATINFVAGPIRQSVMSDENGIAELSGMVESVNIRLNITHKEYVTLNESWQFNANENNTKVITLIKGKNISGQVLFQDKPVANALVCLYRSGNNNPIAKNNSNTDGSFFFSNIENNKDKTYTIKAFHQEYGVASASNIDFEKENSILKLNLTEEKSLLIKLVDNQKKPLANKTITLTNFMEQNFSLSFETNENGEYQLLNMMHGFYLPKLEDENLKLKTRSVQIPNNEITLEAESKDLRKINITLPNGQPFTGFLKANLEMNRNAWPLEIITGDDGQLYLNVSENGPARLGSFVFEAQGYAVAKLGPYENHNMIPKEFNIKLKEGENFSINVLDGSNDTPLQGVTVDIYSGNTKIQSMPTNELGEITFIHLADIFTINIKQEGYCIFNSDFDGTKLKDATVRLIHGGGLKGHLTLEESLKSAYVILQPNGGNKSINADGNFEYNNLVPGEYTLTISKNPKDGKIQLEKIPVQIIIENDKTFEINLDDFLKNQTTLDVRVLQDGSLSMERGFLNISDRRGQSVVATQITNGAHRVERILPGEYLLNYNFQGKALKKSLTILPKQNNEVEIYVPGSSLTISVKNEEGKPVSKVMITLYAGEKYRQEDTYLGSQFVTDANGSGTFLLMPKSPYYFVVEEDFRSNYQVNVIGPIMLEAGQNSNLEYILPYAKKMPKIQIVDTSNKPLPDVGFIFNDEKGNFFQRTLKKEWDLYPFSNKEGFLPENCWPKTDFTLVVGKEGYEFKEVQFSANYDPNQLVQIKLNRSSSIQVNFLNTLELPISVGILNKDGNLLQKPIPLPNRQKKELTVYYENISFGSVPFNDLSAGTYYVGYFWNGSSRLISRQGPISLNPGERQSVNSTLQITDY